MLLTSMRRKQFRFIPRYNRKYNYANEAKTGECRDCRHRHSNDVGGESPDSHDVTQFIAGTCNWSHVARFRVSIQHKFLRIRSSIDPTFCGIFIWGPLQFKCQFINWSNEDFEVGISRKFEKLVNMYIRK